MTDLTQKREKLKNQPRINQNIRQYGWCMIKGKKYEIIYIHWKSFALISVSEDWTTIGILQFIMLVYINDNYLSTLTNCNTTIWFTIVLYNSRKINSFLKFLGIHNIDTTEVCCVIMNGFCITDITSIYCCLLRSLRDYDYYC